MRERLAAIRNVLPRGLTLPEENWRHRHRGILALLWLHAIAVPIVALTRGFPLGHALLEGMILPAAAIAATPSRVPRRLRAGAASVGLLSASAVLVHLSGGLIEMHFHFFVMVAVVALYQDWIPFLASIAYVLLHHGVIGALDPRSVFNHPAALNHPWRWAGIHAIFIAGISVACLVTWRLNEVALEQRRTAEDRLRRESRIVATLNDVGRTLAAELDLRGVMQKVTDAATTLTSAGFGAFFNNVEGPQGESYMLYTIAGVPTEAFARFPMPRNTPLFAATFTGQAVVRIDDVKDDPRYGHVPPHFGMPEGHLPVRSYLAVPVRSRSGEVVGGLFFGHEEPARFTEDEEIIAVGIAAHASIALDNARLYEAERRAHVASERARERLSIMAEASRVLASSLDVDSILTDLAGIVVPEIADTCVVYLREPNGGLRSVAAHASPELAGTLAAALAGKSSVPVPSQAEDPVVRAMAERRLIMLEEVSEDLLDRTMIDPEHRELMRALGPTSAVVAPLVGREEVFGALALGTLASTGRRLLKDDAALAEELARRAAVAVENARLFAAQRSAAETLQHSLLPERLPAIAGIETAARYLPGGPGVEVGGDWYDVLELPNGSLGLVMGDVVGRGVEAASLMGQLRNALRANAHAGHGPAETLRRLNAMLSDFGPSDGMATLVYGVFDPETGTLRISNAGHPPPMIAGLDGRVELFEEARGVPLGATARAAYTEMITTIAPGATLLLYTDGLVEDRTMSLDDGIERVRAAMADAPGDLDAACEHLLRRSMEGRASCDDVALLALRLMPLGPRLRMRLPSDPNILKSLRCTMRRWLSEQGCSELEVFDVILALGEASTNAIQHSGRATGDFDVEADAGSDLTIVVRDRGTWRAPRESTGGRGISIMRELMDAVNVETGESGTTVTMRKALAVGADRRA